jgi:hypothetical protein
MTQGMTAERDNDHRVNTPINLSTRAYNNGYFLNTAYAVFAESTKFSPVTAIILIE